MSRILAAVIWSGKAIAFTIVIGILLAAVFNREVDIPVGQPTERTRQLLLAVCEHLTERLHGFGSKCLCRLGIQLRKGACEEGRQAVRHESPRDSHVRIVPEDQV